MPLAKLSQNRGFIQYEVIIWFTLQSKQQPGPIWYIHDGSLCVEFILLAGDETLKCLTLLLHVEPVTDSEKAFSPLIAHDLPRANVTITFINPLGERKVREKREADVADGYVKRDEASQTAVLN